MPDFSSALEAAREELARLRRDRQSLDVEIAKMENVIAALSAVTGQDEEAMQTSGLTDAIRAVLRMAPEGLTPTEVRSRLDAAGFNFSVRYTNVMANIHIVLKRLEQSGEATVIETENATGKRYYWTMNPPQFKQLSRTLNAVASQPQGTPTALLMTKAEDNPSGMQEIIAKSVRRRYEMTRKGGK